MGFDAVAGTLRPTDVEMMILPSGRSVAVPKAQPTFRPFVGPQPDDTYGGKCLLDFNGRPAFAELAILWSLEQDGWQGVWIDTYRKKFRRGYWGVDAMSEVPDAWAREQLDRVIAARGGRRAGAWDVYCWRSGAILFAESKWKGRDRIRNSQLAWLEAGLGTGLSVDSFLMVEWTMGAPSAPGD